MVIATENRTMAAEHHRVAGMCRSPEFRQQRPELPRRISQGMVERRELVRRSPP
jgi:hypothetical protein